MKSLILPLILSAGAAFAVPTVSNVKVSQGDSGGAVKITDQELFVRPVLETFTLDGSLEENTYTGYDWIHRLTPLDVESATDNGYYLPVGPEYRYIETLCGAFSTTDGLYVVFRASAGKKTPIADDDKVGVALSPDGRTILSASCSAEGSVEAFRIDVESGKRTVVDATAIPCKCKRTRVSRFNPTSFVVEMKISYDLIGAKPGKNGAKWPCNFFRLGPSCGGRASWAPVSAQSDMYEIDRFGTLLFEGGKSGDEAALPENAGKKAFLWTGARWTGAGSSAKAPLDEREVTTVTMSAPRGARAIAHLRVSNLTDRPQLYTATVENFAKDEFARRLRFRELADLELKGGPVIPDPVFNLPNGSVLRIPAKSTAFVWIDVATDGLTNGVHAAKVTLVPGYSDMETKTFAVELNVGRADVSEVDMPVWAYPLRWADDYRQLADYRFNVICLGPFQYAVKKDGRPDWTSFDEAIEACVAAGVKQSDVRILFYNLMPGWCRGKIGKPEWEKETVADLRRAAARAKECFGIGRGRLYFSPTDEPSGDPDDPKSGAWHALYGAKLARQADPDLKTFTNPFKCEPEYLQRYIDAFDTLEPYLFRITEQDPGNPARYAACGREIWSYAIFLKQNQPTQYRKIHWNNLDYGFRGPAVFYDMFDAKGDAFNSYDANGGPDYNAAFRDRRTRQLSPSRRLECWYLGLVDFKLATWCRTHLESLRTSGRVAEADAFAVRLDALVKRAVAARPDYDALGLELLKLSDEIDVLKSKHTK